MRSRTLALIAALVAVPAAAAWTHYATTMSLRPESRLWVDGSSTLRSFTCKAAALEATVTATAADPAAAVVAGEKAITGVTFTVPALRLDCGNGTMNEHMFKAIRAKEHGTIEFRLSSYELARGPAGVVATLHGSLTLGGVTKPIVLRADAEEKGPGTLRVAGAHEITMSQYGLKAPTLMMGTLKVRDQVRVGFDLLLKGEAPRVAAHVTAHVTPH